MILLITFSYSVMCIFRILINNTDFVSSFCDVLHTHCHDMLFSVIIHMSLNFHFSWFWVSLFLVRLFHISFCLLQWTLFLSYLFLNFAQFVLINLLIFLMHLMTVLFELIFSLILLICDAFLNLLLMQVIMLLISNHKWFFFFIKIM